MSLQDDYFELSESLSGHKLEKLNRIWDAFCEMDAEYEDLLRIKNSVKNLVTLCFQEEPPVAQKNQSGEKNE